MGDIRKLLLLLQYHGPILGRTRFQKLVFLLQSKYNINLGYDFIPYFYGPYSKRLQLDINWIGANKVVKVEAGYKHSLTPEGNNFLADTTQESEANLEEALRKAVEELKNRSTQELVSEAKSTV